LVVLMPLLLLRFHDYAPRRGVGLVRGAYAFAAPPEVVVREPADTSEVVAADARPSTC